MTNTILEALRRGIDALEWYAADDTDAAEALPLLRAAEAEVDGMKEITLPIDAEDYWKEAIGGTYHPSVLSKGKACHPTTVKRMLAEYKGSEAADVIVSLVHQMCVVGQREKLFIEELQRRETLPTPPQQPEEGQL